MKVLELFSGTRSIGEAFEKRGHEVFSVEWDESLPADLHADIEFLKAPDVLRAFGRPDVVWASPDCATFSMAGISRHRRKNANTGNLDAARVEVRHAGPGERARARAHPREAVPAHR